MPSGHIATISSSRHSKRERCLSSALSRVRIPCFLQNAKRTPGWTSFPSQTGGELGIPACMRMPHRCGAHAPCVLRWTTLTRCLSSALSRVRIPCFLQNGKRTPGWTSFPSQTGGELGIRTPDALLGHTRLAGEHLRPLGQLSVTAVISYPTRPQQYKKRNASLQNSPADTQHTMLNLLQRPAQHA